MLHKEVVMEMRVNRLLKGKKPCYIYLKKNNGEIYKGGQSDFIMTITDKYLHFQRISMFLKKPLPAHDFKVARDTIKTYSLFDLNIALSSLVLYTTDRKFIQIFFNKGIPDTVETVENIDSIINILVEQGVKEYKWKI